MIRGWREWFLEKSITSVNRNIFNIYIFNIYSIIGSTINYTIFLYDLILAERNFFFRNERIAWNFSKKDLPRSADSYPGTAYLAVLRRASSSPRD